MSERSDLIKRFGIVVKGDAVRWRSDGRIERVCEHGIGHTISVKYVKYREPDGSVSPSWWAHGCDGCCKDYERE